MTLQGGTQELADALVPKLLGTLRPQTAVRTLHVMGEHGYRLETDGGDALEADAVVIAAPAYAAADLVRPLAPEAADLLAAIRYVSTGTLSLAYRSNEIAHPLNGFGVVIPRSERRPINAITWSSTKFEHRAPQGYELLRIFFGGSRSPQMMDVADDELLAIARSELQELMGIDAAPIFHRIYRWHRANAQYDVGHLERVAAIEQALPAHIYVSGSPYRGVGIPDCVHQAQITAEQVVDRLSTARAAETGA